MVILIATLFLVGTCILIAIYIESGVPTYPPKEHNPHPTKHEPVINLQVHQARRRARYRVF